MKQLNLKKKSLLLLLVPMFSWAQKTIEKQQLFWYGYFNQLQCNENWTVLSEIQQRQFYNPTAQHQLVFRSNVERKLANDWNASLGLTFFLQNPNEPTSKSSMTVPEWRPDMGFVHQQKMKGFTISHRYKMEARFLHQVTNEQLVGGYQFSNFRFRYQLGFEIPLWKQNGNDKISIKIKEELLCNVGQKVVKNVFDQNRIYVGLQYKCRDSFAIEAGYMNIFQQQKSGTDFYDRDIVRLALYHKIVLKNKTKHE